LDKVLQEKYNTPKKSIDVLATFHRRTVDEAHRRNKTPPGFVVESNTPFKLDKTHTTAQQMLAWTVHFARTFEETVSKSFEQHGNKKELELMKTLAPPVRDLGHAVDTKFGHLHRNIAVQVEEAQLDMHRGHFKQFVFSNIRRMMDYIDPIHGDILTAALNWQSEAKALSKGLQRSQRRTTRLMGELEKDMDQITELLQNQIRYDAMIRRYGTLLAQIGGRWQVESDVNRRVGVNAV
jgi:hypothetical protein